MKTFDLQKFLKENYWYEKGFDLNDLKAIPVPTTVGEGHCFEIAKSNGDIEHFETKADRTQSGKRIVTFRFSTLRGVSFNATHYYCRVSAYMYNVCVETGGHVAGYLGGHKIPQENDDMIFQLSNMVPYQELNEKEQFSLFGGSTDWEHYADENGLVKYTGFNDEAEMRTLANEVAAALFPSDEWEVEFEE